MQRQRYLGLISICKRPRISKWRSEQLSGQYQRRYREKKRNFRKEKIRANEVEIYDKWGYVISFYSNDRRRVTCNEKVKQSWDWLQ